MWLASVGENPDFNATDDSDGEAFYSTLESIARGSPSTSLELPLSGPIAAAATSFCTAARGSKSLPAKHFIFEEGGCGAKSLVEISPGQLQKDYSYLTPDGLVELVDQSDGNLVLYGRVDSIRKRHVRWAALDIVTKKHRHQSTVFDRG